MELTALKVKIGLRVDGSAAYPNFNSMPIVSASGLDWSKYVDTQGLGWNYDKVSGHQEETVDSPRGQQFGVLVIPEQFAIEAVANFPAECSRIDETALEVFYDTKAAAHLPGEVINQQIIDGLRDTFALMKETGATQVQLDKIKAKIKKAINPNDLEPGVRKNYRKKWADLKVKTNVTIKNPV